MVVPYKPNQEMSVSTASAPQAALLSVYPIQMYLGQAMVKNHIVPSIGRLTEGFIYMQTV